MLDISNIESLNDQIVTIHSYGQSHAKVNRLFFKSLMGNQLSSSDLDDLRDIADNCLEEEGFAIFSAINLLPLCEHDNYIDITKNVCVRSTSTTWDEDVKISLFPNPSNGEILNFESDKKISGILEVFSIDGKRIGGRTFTDLSNMQFETNLTSGSYLWSALLSTGEVHSGKLLIIRD